MTQPDRTTVFAAALRDRSRRPWTGDVADGWRTLAAEALADARITLTDEQFNRAWRALWQSAFMGGNFALDAERVLRAAYEPAVT